VPENTAPENTDPDDSRLSELLGVLSQLDTEAAAPDRGDLDLLSTTELVRRMNAEDQRVAIAVAERTDEIARAVDGITERLRRGGRLIYIGAGTAGRIGVLDASECPPTFGTDPSLVVGIIAGGERAIRSAVENAEDDTDAAAGSLRELELTERDTVVGISASGRTPYVVGGLDFARGIGALTVAIAANRDSAIGAAAEIPIEIVTGAEFISGSTRLKAGTAQKLVVNMLTTLSMIKLGHEREAARPFDPNGDRARGSRRRRGRDGAAHRWRIGEARAAHARHRCRRGSGA
jgi:N-acetylmuramic acid 6-phosphate etherase